MVKCSLPNFFPIKLTSPRWANVVRVPPGGLELEIPRETGRENERKRCS